MNRRAVIAWIVLQTAVGVWLASLLFGGTRAVVGSSLDPGAEPATPASPAARHTDAEREVVALAPHDRDAVPGRGSAGGGGGGSDGVVLFGLVTDRAGAPVADAGLYARPIDGPGVGTQSASNGAWSFHLEPGVFDLVVREQGFADHEERVELTPGAHRHDIALARSAVLQVFVRTVDGEPLDEALHAAGVDERIRPRAIATRRAPGDLPLLEHFGWFGIGKFRSARWLGTVNIEGAPPEQLGTIEIGSGLPAHVSLTLGPAVVATQLVEQGQERVEFTVPLERALAELGSIRLQLVSATTAQPLAGVRVDGPRVELTAADGVAVFERILPGLHRLSASGRKGLQLSRFVRVEPGQAVDLGRVIVAEPVHVKGIVVDARGDPVRAGITWTDLELRSFPQPLGHPVSTGSSESGEWTISMEPHRHSIRARLDDDSQVAHVVVDPAALPPGESVRLRLRPTARVELIKEFDSEQVFLLSVRTREGVPCFGEFVLAGFAQSIRLPAGNYVADVHDGLALVRSFAFTVGDDPTQIRVP